MTSALALLLLLAAAAPAGAAVLDDASLDLGNASMRAAAVGKVGFGDAPVQQVEVRQGGAVKLGNAFLSSGGPQYMHLASNAWYNGSSWVVPASARSALMQFSNFEINLYQSQTAGGADFQTAFNVNHNGIVTMPKQPYFIAGHVNANWESVGAAGWYEIGFNTVGSGNAGSWYNTSTGRFTAPVAGLYLFHATLYTQNNQCYPGYFHFDIGVNGCQYCGGGRPNGSLQIVGANASEGTYNTSVFATRLLYLNAGDYASVWDYIAGAGCYRYGSHSYFAGILLH